MPRPLLLIDSASLYFRAYHGIPEAAARAAGGQPVNAVRGFLDMLATLIRTRAPGRMVCALDEDWRPAWRVALIASYKTHRVANLDDGSEAVPDNLARQVPIILDLLEAIGIPAIGAAGYEADDVIGTLAVREPGPVEIATGDRDLIQLIDDERGVVVLYCGRGVARLEVLDDAAVRERYGVPAAGYADLAVLRGDPSDGLPGVNGIGNKSATQLVARFGSLAAIIAALEDPQAVFPLGVRPKLIAARPYLAVAPAVVRVARDVPLPPIETALPARPRQPQRLADLAARWNATGPVNRLVEALSRVDQPQPGPGPAPSGQGPSESGGGHSSEV